MQLRVGDRILNIEMVNGVPTVQGVWSEEIKHPDGRQDVIVHVPSMAVGADRKKTGLEG